MGLGKGLTVLELVESFKKSSGKEVPLEIVGRRVGDVPKLVCDPSLAQSELGWYPTLSVQDMCKLFSQIKYFYLFTFCMPRYRLEVGYMTLLNF